ncbi:MAG: 3-dehydroquinate synthase [Candidatus Micrarchaeota archaeon]|nr:3-dehydroquinate synthase [Candidatus Micrarchaeota archaeon]
MRVLELKAASGNCKLLIGESIERVMEYCNAKKVIIITDKNVLQLHGHTFPKCEMISIDSGEGIKTLETVEIIYERLLELEVDRSSIILGIGGGIVCDITGFVATTYLRGIRFGFVPTTLLAQVDASIGGKNGVNFKGYKNMIGAIRQPEFCLFDFELLKTLPESEMKCGFAEIAKHAAIGDASLFSYLEVNYKEILKLKKSIIEKVIYDSLKIKADIVAKDESEKGERMKLNFGHTLGHAIEKTVGLPHGKAVSLGMVLAANISAKKGLLDKKEVERIVRLLENVGLPTKIDFDKNMVIDAMRKDKKRRGDEINMVLLKSIGNVMITKIKIDELEAMIHEPDMC